MVLVVESEAQKLISPRVGAQIDVVAAVDVPVQLGVEVVEVDFVVGVVDGFQVEADITSAPRHNERCLAFDNGAFER